MDAKNSAGLVIEQATFKPMILRSPLNSNRNLLVIPGIMYSLSKPRGKSGEDNSTFVYESFTFRLFGKNTHRLGIQAALFMRPRFSHHFLAVYVKKSRRTLRAEQNQRWRSVRT